MSGGLVKEQQGRVSQERAGQRDPLPLARGQPQAALAERRVVPGRQLLDEVGGAREPGGPAMALRFASAWPRAILSAAVPVNR